MKMVIMGNSGSGKSTLASKVAKKLKVPMLDLDTIAWAESDPPRRRPETESERLLDAFCEHNADWVIEGCYGDLLASACQKASDLWFLNPGVKVCQQNCRNRAWEPHKYESQESQDKNLHFLLEWVGDYESRADEFSVERHREVFDAFAGKKRELVSNEEAQQLWAELEAGPAASG